MRYSDFDKKPLDVKTNTIKDIAKSITSMKKTLCFS